MDWSELDIKYQEGGIEFVISRPSIVVSYYGSDQLRNHIDLVLDWWKKQISTNSKLFYLGPASRSFKLMSDKLFARYKNNLQSNKVEYLFIKDAPDFDIGFHSIEAALHDLSFPEALARVYIAFPIKWTESEFFENLVDEFASLLETLNVNYASMGLGFSIVFGREFEQAAAAQLAAACTRYLGFDLPHRFTELNFKSEIKGPAWITYIDNKFAKIISKEEIYSDQSNTDLTITNMQNGLLFRTGSKPPIGDKNRGSKDLNALKTLYRILKPICFQSWEISPLTAEHTAEKFEKWLTRLQ